MAQHHCGLNGGKAIDFLVPGEGIEPPTNGLQNRCSTAELTRHRPVTTTLFHFHKRTISEIATGLPPDWVQK
jgi:hypothetical protein